MKNIFVLFLAIFFTSSAWALSIDLKPGDIIGESEILNDSSTAYIEAATQSRYGHVGIVLSNDDQLVIYEEYPPFAQIVSVKEFLSRAPGHFTVIRRNKNFSPEEIATLKSHADKLVEARYPYNYSQTQNDESMNCSEFVKFILSKINVSVGKVQTIKDMNLKAFHHHPWRLWKFGAKDLKKTDKVVTPKSIMQTEGWKKIDGDLDPLKDYSDRDLYLSWKEDKAVKIVAKEWYIFDWELNLLSK